MHHHTRKKPLNAFNHAIPLSALALLSGSWAFQQSSTLPGWSEISLGAGCLAVSILLRSPYWLMAGIVGWLWAANYAIWHAPPAINHLDIRENYQAIGIVSSLPEARSNHIRFQFRVSQLNSTQQSRHGDWLLQVKWYQPQIPAVKVGEQWQLSLRIKPVHGYRNPGGWDYDAWLYHQGIRYTAYVKSSETAQLIGANQCCWLNKQREYLRERINKLNLSEASKGIILALTVGDKSGLSNEIKQQFRLTGTSHLMAISGLHIGLVAGLVAGIVSGLWRRTPFLCARYPAMLAGASAGLAAACLYALLSGLGLPAQRALIMLTVAAIALLQRKPCRPFDILALAAIAVCLYQPNAVLAGGFWLSFTAVAAILILLAQTQSRHWMTRALLVQLGISLALYPILLLFGLSSHLLAPLVNLILVPIFTVLIVPVSLFSIAWLAVFDWPGEILTLLGHGLDWLIILLSFFAKLDHFQIHTSAKPWWLYAALLSGILILLAPVKWHWRLIGVCLFGFGHMPTKPYIAPGDYQITLLDVGQGLSAVVQTHHHTLVYDTGAAYSSGFNLADSVLTPYLRHQNIQQIDTMIISHGDNDHAGAAAYLLDKIPMTRLLSGEPHRLPMASQPCQANHTWTWDGVTFTLLHPGRPDGGKSKPKSNNLSCILIVSNSVGDTLLPGDIEKRMEYQLMPAFMRHAPYRVVMAPHHGSNSSSSSTFTKITQAEHVLHPVGAYNRYRFPHKQVLKRWETEGAQNWRTDQSGAIQFHFARQEGLLGPFQHRVDHKRYWHFPMLKH